MRGNSQSKSLANRPRPINNNEQSLNTNKSTSTSSNIRPINKSINSAKSYISDDELSSSYEEQNYKANKNSQINKNNELSELRFKYNELKSLVEDKTQQNVLLESIIKTNNLLSDVLEQQKNIISRIDNIEDKLDSLNIEHINTTNVTTASNEQIPISNNKIPLLPTNKNIK